MWIILGKVIFFDDLRSQKAQPSPGQPRPELAMERAVVFSFRTAAGAERVMFFFFAAPASAGALHDFFSKSRPGPGRATIFSQGPRD